VPSSSQESETTTSRDLTKHLNSMILYDLVRPGVCCFYEEKFRLGHSIEGILFPGRYSIKMKYIFLGLCWVESSNSFY
jgi:hypothetical protein